ncbi:MAG: hypothetical protein A2600_10330 [Candidatus Lambdaproteobacteria bacterium RIFOXYD1_FULL_56_27]|uniref:Uncharacterized protein n=1 Tax=Candidatus Lambdaproteobacteria bacterium RIFOXYD2_FULL_56_26 TaxID=1817773 RepID=A0A1F6GQI8_9PROT|nr:MAG: hypothetical protein A2557_09355 [Candidatus Lambdaproteobacteria bacterium RIFOXYD2_FULL_56_26]OGH04138.1 MAG: hypothetical protein A2426_02745 [Candidatus Lambdaproteobacteria bacterium RIFOXYC1_FULL_56_13]OGH06345.1 MAG: hypothetical protein A2600_10330 [Candidatus Lambdaproteobacteria bacterium RIFOXYD1_FULL_56_27]
MKLRFFVLLFALVLALWGGPALAQDGQGFQEATENPKWSEDCSMLTDSPEDAAQKANCPAAEKEEPMDQGQTGPEVAPAEPQVSSGAAQEAPTPMESPAVQESPAPMEAPVAVALPAPAQAQPEPQSPPQATAPAADELAQPTVGQAPAEVPAEAPEEEDAMERTNPQDWVDSKER